MSTLVARKVTSLTTPLMVLVALNFFLQGHNLPGGGFIAGVLTAVAVALVYVVFDLQEAHRLIGRRDITSYYVRMSAAGLIFSAGIGAFFMALGSPFLAQDHAVFHIPLIDKLHLTTALIFDLGVYLVVMDSLLNMVEVIGRE